ncbi:MAG TPA: hypothetical protein VMV94_00785 [Phycisphaerae bacterium]|nr:hypothetical protein [Phycisphaerae bacterium]
MVTPDDIAEQVAASSSWNHRVALIRTIPEKFGVRQHADVYAAIARKVYAPHITADFAYVHWRDEYELPALQAAYDETCNLTASFSRVDRSSLKHTLVEHPKSLQVFRLLLGLTASEFAEACSLAAGGEDGLAKITKSTLKSIEGGRPTSESKAEVCAVTIDLAMRGELFPPAGRGRLRSKLEKPDTAKGWESVRRFAREGVPLPVFLHQRAYGGAFRQLLDATSSSRGDLLEGPVEDLFRENDIPYIRTGSHNQKAVERDFGLSVRPAPDFVVYSAQPRALRAILECKATNDGGTARDKASRYKSLKQEASRLGGIPVFAVLGGSGWRRARDALGPVIRDTDGRTFTPATLSELLHVDPFPDLLRASGRHKRPGTRRGRSGSRSPRL